MRSDVSNAKSTLKLLFFLVDGYPTFRPDIEVLFGKCLAERGVLSDLVTTRNPALPVDKDWPGGKLFLSPKRSRFEAVKSAVVDDVLYLMKITSCEYDAVQVRDKPVFSLLVLIAAKLFRKPFFYWMSFPYPESQLAVARAGVRQLGLLRYLSMIIRGRLGEWILYRLVIPQADHVFVQSEKMLMDVVERSGRKDGLTPVPMGFDQNDFEPEEPGNWDAPTILKLVYLGSCDRVRRVDFLLEALKVVLDAGCSCELVIIGDATEDHDKHWLRKRVEELGLESQVTITGWIDQKGARAMMRSADVGLALMAPHPILDSTSPTKLVEYMAAGLPVVANDHPDQRKLVSESGGGIVTRFDVYSYAQGILTIAGDPNGRMEMGDAAAEYISKVRNYESISNGVEAVYRDLLD